LKDQGVLGMTVEKFWEHNDKDYNKFEYGKPRVTKLAHIELLWPTRRLHKWDYLACVYVACNLSKVMFLKRYSRVKVLI
jgi:hypothetical protein